MSWGGGTRGSASHCVNSLNGSGVNAVCHCRGRVSMHCPVAGSIPRPGVRSVSISVPVSIPCVNSLSLCQFLVSIPFQLPLPTACRRALLPSIHCANTLSLSTFLSTLSPRLNAVLRLAAHSTSPYIHIPPQPSSYTQHKLMYPP